MRLIRFGIVDLPEPDGDHALPINARSALIELPNGAFDQDGSRVVLKTAQLRYQGLVVDSLDPTVQALLKEIGKGRNIMRARMRDNIQELVTYAKVTSVQRVAKAGEWNYKQPLSITFEQDYPYWINGADGLFFDNGLYFDSGYNFDGKYEDRSITSNPHTWTINNDGTARVPMGTIVIIPNAASSIVNPRVANNTNGLNFQYTGTVGANQRLVIDFLTKTVELDGVNAYSAFSLGSVRQSAFMELELGNNEITVTGWASGTVKLYWIWRRHYL